MRIRFADHLRVVGFSVCAVLAQGSRSVAYAQADVALQAQLLGKAQTLASRGRLDLAAPVWQQVLLMDPRSRDALEGLARAARQQGNESVAQNYLAQLRATAPPESHVAQASPATMSKNPALLLGAAGNLARAGQPSRAMAIYRQLYGENPPAGTPALAYYETEAATADWHAQGVAGLRALARRYPDDTRYALALGRILLADPQTRAEGRGMLESLSKDPEAKSALKQISGNDLPAAALPSYPQSFAVAHAKTPAAMTSAKTAEVHAVAATSFAAKPVIRPQAGRTAELQAAYGALNAHFLLTAESNFESVLDRNPRSWQALAGLGYVRLRQANFPGAISFLEQAKEYGGRGAAIEKALGEARFRATLQAASAALSRNEFPAAQQAFAAALGQRPGDPAALQGLGGTLLGAQQGEAAVEVFRQYTQAHPADPAAWHGLLVAQVSAGRPADALGTETQIPLATRRDLMFDPRFLLALAAVDKATGNTNEAQAVLNAGLDLPFPDGGLGLTPDLQARYAALLAAAGRPEAAVSLYRQVLAADAGNSAAWMGLIAVQGAMGQAAAASATLHGLPTAVKTVAMRDPAFVSVVAGLEIHQGHQDRARETLEDLLAQQAASGYTLFVPAQLQLAGLYVQGGELSRALPIYHEILRKAPGRLDAWKQLVDVLHATGHDTEAVAQLKQLSPEVRAKLEADPAFLELAGDTYASAGQPQTALPYLQRAQGTLQAAGNNPPAGLGLQIASLQYATGADADLYRQLMVLGGRPDLTPAERATMQSIWADWAVRRAVAQAGAGDPHGAAEVLNTALEAFSGNAEVARTLAGGFVSAGLAKDAEAIFRARNMTDAPAADFRAAISAAMAANDHKLAEVWLHLALAKYPNEPQLLLLASKYEDTRGHDKRAKVYLQASLEATPAPFAGAELARELNGSGLSPRFLTQGVEVEEQGLPGSSRFGSTAEATQLLLNGSIGGPRSAAISASGSVYGVDAASGQGSAGQSGARLRDFRQ